MLRIQFLCFDGCPLADAAESALRKALTVCGIDEDQYETVNILEHSTPADLSHWGSPTILINGTDVAGQEKGDGVGCRIYETIDQVPTVEMIASAVNAKFTSSDPLT